MELENKTGHERYRGITKKYTAYLILLGIVLLYFLGNLVLCCQQSYKYNLLMNGSDAIHFRTVLEMYEDMRAGTFSLFSLHYYNAPLTSLILAGLIHFGKDYIAYYILFVNLSYFALALFFTYKIGERMLDSNAGILAASLLAMYPSVYGLSRVYGRCDFALMAAMTLNIFCLIKSDGFRDTRWSLLYGISVGLGMLAKDSFVAFFPAPLAFAAVTALVAEEKKGKVAVRLTVALLIGAALASLHYADVKILKKVSHELVNEPEGPWYTFDNLRVYTLGLSEELLSPPFFIVFLLGIWGFVKTYHNGKTKNLILLWFIVPWLIFLLMPHKKETVYAVPYVPAIAVISAIGIRQFCTARFVRYLIMVMIPVGVLQYAEFSYGWGIGLHDSKIHLRNEKKIWYYHLVNNEMFFYRDERRKTYEKIAAALESELAENRNNRTILVTMEEIDEDVVDTKPMELMGWLHGFSMYVVSDSIFVDDNIVEAIAKGGAYIVLNVGRFPFATSEYFDAQTALALDRKEEYISLYGESVKKKIRRAFSGDFKEQLTAFSKTFIRQKEIFVIDGNMRGVLYFQE